MKEIWQEILNLLNRLFKERHNERDEARKMLCSDLITLNIDLIAKLIKTKFANAKLYCADSEYKVPKWENFLQWLNTDSLQEMRWLEDEWDCDNFALESNCRAKQVIGNISYGFVWNSEPPHAYNILVCQKDNLVQVMQIEPQNDSISHYPADKAYLVVI